MNTGIKALRAFALAFGYAALITQELLYNSYSIKATEFARACFFSREAREI